MALSDTTVRQARITGNDYTIWVIPAEVVKQLQLAMRKPGKQNQNVPPYIVPLSVQALEIVRYLPAAGPLLVWFDANNAVSLIAVGRV
jgi:hypothetical protein